MVNAGRILIIAKGAWDSLTSYEQLDLVTRNDTAYLARQGSVGVDPATDTAMTYWQPFGTAVKIATTSVPGIVMPDGTTITIDETGLIKADLGISDLKNVVISSIANGQILQYNSATQKWENKSLGTAAARNATSSITSGSSDLIESGAVSSLKQTLESKIGAVTVKTLVANATTISFTVPTTGNNLIEFFISDGSNYTDIDTSVSGTVTLTFEASASARTVSCRIAVAS